MTTTAPPAEERASAPAEVASARPSTGTEARGLRLRHLWAIVPLAAAWFAAAIDYIEPYDFWWNVKSGQIMTQTRQFLGTDVLVWSPVREPYSNPQWGSQLLFYWVYALSPYLLLTLRVLIITATVAFLFWLCKWRSGSLRAASVAATIAYLTAWTNYGMRPQILAFLPFVAFLFLLERKDTHPKWLPLLVPVMLFWVNVHGSFFLGIGLMGIYGLGTLLEKLRTQEGRVWLRSRAAAMQVGWMGAAALVTLANPYFATIYRYFFIATNDPIARSLNMEWQAPTLYDGTGQLFFAQLAVLAVSFYLGRRKLRPTEILLMLAFGYLALISLRNVMWWGWVTAPIMASNFAAFRRRQTAYDGGQIEDVTATTHQGRLHGPERGGSSLAEGAANRRLELPLLNWTIALVLVGGALIFTPLWREVNPLVPAPARGPLSATTPTKLAAFLSTGSVPAPLFNYMEWGGYLEWELYPKYRMFIDGRFEARRVEVWKDYLSISRGRADWHDTLDKYGVRTLVLSKEFHADLLPYLNKAQQWKKVYEDKMALVYTR